MPDDEGLLLHRVRPRAAPARPGAGGRHLLRQVRGLPRRRGPRGRRRPSFTVDHHRGSEENQAGWEHHDPSARRRRVRPDGHAAGLPAHPRPGRARGRRGRRRRPLAPRSPRTGARRCRCCSSTAGTPRSTPRTTTPAGRRWVMRRRAAGRSTTCSPTPPTAGGRRTTSSCGRWRAAASTEVEALGLAAGATASRGRRRGPGRLTAQPHSSAELREVGGTRRRAAHDVGARACRRAERVGGEDHRRGGVRRVLGRPVTSSG